MKIIIILMSLGFSGCGQFDRFKSAMTGNASETCMYGVTYYQFTSGAAPAYNPDGSLRLCK